MIRSMSGLERSASCNYVVLPPGMPVMATTPARNCCDKSSAAVEGNTLVATGLLSSLLVFFMWVGAWGAIDTIIQLATDFQSYQLAIYLSILVLGSIGLWLQIADWKRAQEDLDNLAV